MVKCQSNSLSVWSLWYTHKAVDAKNVRLHKISTLNILLEVSQKAFTCTKLTIEALQEGVKYVES